jgi:hypothetical protein
VSITPDTLTEFCIRGELFTRVRGRVILRTSP